MRSISFLRRFRDPLAVLLALLLPFVFYVSNSKAPRDYNVFDRVVVFVSAPVQWLTVSALEGITSTWRHYVDLVDTRKENERLRAENAKLLAEVQKREEYRLENERLRRILRIRDRAPDVQAVLARVIATSPTPLFRSIRVDRGTAQGVHVGAAVINQDGVVGRVAAASSGWADIMLLADANSSMDVLVQRTRARARVRGSGGDHEMGIEVEYLARTEEVEPGDVLITSGTGNVFPKGVRVGTVSAVERAAYGLYQTVRVQPSVDFGRIEEVLIIPSGWPPYASFEQDTSVPSTPDAGVEQDTPAASPADAGVEPDEPVASPPAEDGRQVDVGGAAPGGATP